MWVRKQIPSFLIILRMLIDRNQKMWYGCFKNLVDIKNGSIQIFNK